MTGGLHASCPMLAVYQSTSSAPFAAAAVRLAHDEDARLRRAGVDALRHGRDLRRSRLDAL
jgi:hypothetical protein